RLHGSGPDSGSWAEPPRPAARQMGLVRSRQPGDFGSAPVVQRDRAAAEYGADRERAARFDDARDREDVVKQQGLVIGEAGGGDLDHEVVLAGDDVTCDDRGDGQQGFLDPVRGLPGVALDLQADKDRQSESYPGPADLGTVTLDDPAGLQRLDPAQAGGR